MFMTFPSSPPPFTVGIVLFANVTQLDVTGPYEVFARMPATNVHLVAATLAPIRSDQGLTIVPDLTFATAPSLDIICVPGGTGVNAAMEDEALLTFLQHQASTARYLTSVCTGALILGAAGLLRGYRATTHWLSLDLLPLFGAHPVEQRIVIDENRITGSGVTAGIDFALVIASELCGAGVAQEIQLTIEYNPAPPYNAGTPGVAPADVVQSVVRSRQRVQSARRIIAERAAARLERLQDLDPRSTKTEGISIDSFEPGTTLIVRTRNSQYRFVILLERLLVLVKGGAMFPEPTVVRLEGATGNWSPLEDRLDTRGLLHGDVGRLRSNHILTRPLSVNRERSGSVDARWARSCMTTARCYMHVIPLTVRRQIAATARLFAAVTRTCASRSRSM